MLVGPVTEWSLHPRPIDAHLYKLWRCSTVDEDGGICSVNGKDPTEIKRKADGARSLDERYQ